jgi:hypothetical protein
MPLGPLWARAEVERLEDRRISHPAEAKEIDAAIERLGLANHIQTRMTSFVAVDEQSRVTGEAISLVQPVSRADDARWSVHTPWIAYSRTDTSAAPYYADIVEADRDEDAESVDVDVADMAQRIREIRENRSLLCILDILQIAGSDVEDRLAAIRTLIEEEAWGKCAQALLLLETEMKVLSAPAAADQHPKMAAAVLMAMLGCMPPRMSQCELPPTIAGFDLSPTGAPWKRWMALLEPLRADPTWERLASALERGDMRAVLAATGKAGLPRN